MTEQQCCSSGVQPPTQGPGASNPCVSMPQNRKQQPLPSPFNELPQVSRKRTPSGTCQHLQCLLYTSNTSRCQARVIVSQTLQVFKVLQLSALDGHNGWSMWAFCAGSSDFWEALQSAESAPATRLAHWTAWQNQKFLLSCPILTKAAIATATLFQISVGLTNTFNTSSIFSTSNTSRC